MHELVSIILLLWAGMILGISCLEAWVKFKAPSLRKPVGLDVGRTVFRAFHRVQWALLILIFVLSATTYLVIPIALCVLLALQTFWVFPKLCANVDLILKNETPRKNYYHLIYSCLEFAKLLLLLSCGVYFIIHT